MLKRQLVEQENWIKSRANGVQTLDIGCGKKPYQKYFPRYKGVDYPKVDIHLLPYESNSIGQILLTGVLECVDNPLLAMQEVHRVLKPEGRLIMITRTEFPDFGKHNNFAFTERYIRRIMVGFGEVKIEQEKCFSTVFHRLAHKTRSPLLYLLYFLVKFCDDILPTTALYIEARK